MSDTSDKVNQGMHDAGEMAKDAAHYVGKKAREVGHEAGELAKGAARYIGEKMKDAGKKIKDAGR
jgi:hypothetical protein